MKIKKIVTVGDLNSYYNIKRGIIPSGTNICKETKIGVKSAEIGCPFEEIAFNPDLKQKEVISDEDKGLLLNLRHQIHVGKMSSLQNFVLSSRECK